MIYCSECLRGFMRYHDGVMVCDTCGYSRGLNELEHAVLDMLEGLGKRKGQTAKEVKTK